MNIEIKSWLNLSSEEDKADLAKALLALANTGGGFVILGFEDNGNWEPCSPYPTNINEYNQDAVNGIVHKYAEPPFHCEVSLIKHPKTKAKYPIITVPGGHRVPIRAKKDGPGRQHVRQYAYYIRRPGPMSDEPKSAKEWDDLISRCAREAKEDLLESVRTILLGLDQDKDQEAGSKAEELLTDWIGAARNRLENLIAEESQNKATNRYQHGSWSVGYIITGEVELLSLPSFLQLLRDVKGHETGWPVWLVPSSNEIGPYPFEGMIECWMGRSENLNDPAHSDFWRAEPEGKMFLLRGYQEDSQRDQVEPGTIFDLTIPVWRVGESLLHADRLASEITTSSTQITLRFTWEGLVGRKLVPWATPGRFLSYDRITKQHTVTSEITLTPEEIRSNLPEAVQKITQPLYSVFDFFDPPLSMFQEEITKMRENRF